MSDRKSSKSTIEVLLVGAEIGGIKLQPHLVKTIGHVKLELRA